ncbi:MAG TPA: type III-B CRISPR module RAMP protein Cmr4 [Spirochaetota bacterium]|nr:type III-B CRISPR module RAMP protein Cmr4 [Spirochaetota bacterium]
MNASILLMYGITPCHAGSGASVGVVDLPIQRERHTNWPMIQSSGMKGAMRMHFEKNKSAISGEAVLANSIFGASSADKDNDFAGAFSVSDAKILAFPMRSNVAPFVWITCPAVLKRLARDLALAGLAKEDSASIPVLPDSARALVCCDKISGSVLLEDLEVSVSSGSLPESLQMFFTKAERLLIVSDEVFAYGVSSCTQVVAQISIDQTKGTTKTGSLRYQEELPADSILYSVILWNGTRDEDQKHTAEEVKKWITADVMPTHLQAGGDETLGRGYFELTWI